MNVVGRWSRAELFDTAARLFGNEWPDEWQQKIRCLLNLYQGNDKLVTETLKSVFRGNSNEIRCILSLLEHATQYPHLVDKLSMGKEAVAMVFGIVGREPFDCEARIASFLFKCGANQLRAMEALGKSQ